MSRYHSHYSQDKVSSSKGYPAYQSDGGKKLDDTEKQPPYNANIGEGGPDMNRVGFPLVKAHTKQKMSPYNLGTARIAERAEREIDPEVLKAGSSPYSDATKGLGGALKGVGEAIDGGGDQGFKVFQPEYVPVPSMSGDTGIDIEEEGPKIRRPRYK